MKGTIIVDLRTLRALERAGYIEVCSQVPERHWTGQMVRSRWVRPTAKLVPWYRAFTHRGRTFELHYFDGCFHPFVVELGTAGLPLPPDSVHAFRSEVWVTYRAKEYAQYSSSRALSLPDALAIVEMFNAWDHGNGIEEAEHWKAECVSVLPLAINQYAKGEGSEHVGTSEIELCFDGGQAYPGAQHIIFHVCDRRDGQWYRIKIETTSSLRVSAKETRGFGNRLEARRFDVANRPDGTLYRHWSSGDGSQIETSWHLSIYWPTVEDFRAWVKEQEQKEAL